MKYRIFLILSITLSLNACKEDKKEQEIVETQKSNEMATAYIGTYTKEEGHVNGGAEGIYTVYQDPDSGKLSFGKTVAEVTNPSFVKVSADEKNLYAVSELGPNDGPSGFIHSFRIKEDKSLEEISKISTEAYAPCYIAEDKTGQFIFVANYVGGVVMMYKKENDGSLQKAQNITFDNPEESHPHSVSIPSNNEHIYVADLGNDKIWIFDLNIEKAELNPNAQPFVKLEEGAGPRHFTFSKNEEFAYSINELNSTVTVFRVKENGGLEIIQTVSSLPEDFQGENSAADIHLHPSGKFLYTSNRGHNSLASFSVNAETGHLEPLGFTSTQGEVPRNFAIAPAGDFLYVANQNSDNLVGFRIDNNSGKLEETRQDLEVETPVCIEFIGK